MAKREKFVLPKTLKADDYKDGQNVVLTASINAVDDIETQYGTKTVITITDETSNEKQNVFINTQSMNNLIDAFGDDDKQWLGKMIKIDCAKDENYKKKMLVVSSL